MSTTDRQKLATKLAEELVSFANSYSEEGFEEFVEAVTMTAHRTVQQSFMTLVVKIIQAHAANHDSGCFDDRNKATVALCKKIMDSCGEDLYLPCI